MRPELYELPEPLLAQIASFIYWPGARLAWRVYGLWDVIYFCRAIGKFRWATSVRSLACDITTEDCWALACLEAADPSSGRR